MDSGNGTTQQAGSASSSEIRSRSASIPVCIEKGRTNSTRSESPRSRQSDSLSDAPRSAPVQAPSCYFLGRRAAFPSVGSDANMNRRIAESGAASDVMSPARYRRHQSRSLVSPHGFCPSPHHSRSQSFRGPPGSSSLANEDAVFRPRVATMPTDYSRRRLMYHWSLRDRSLSPAAAAGYSRGDVSDDDYYLLRQFCTTSKGGIINKGDLFRHKSRSNSSVTSTTSVTTSSSDGPGGPVTAPCRVVVLGAPGVGKTALVTQFMSSEAMSTYETSLGK